MSDEFIVESVHHNYLQGLERDLQDKLNAIKNDGGKDIDVTTMVLAGTFVAIIVYRKKTE